MASYVQGLNGEVSQVDRVIFDALSAPRLSTYVRATGNPSTALQLYRLNQELSEVAFTALADFEVAWRNQVSAAIQQHIGRSDWYRARKFTSLLRPQGRAALNEARNRLKADGKPNDSGCMTAALSFGFWASLYSGEVGNDLWPTHLSRHWPKGTKLKIVRKDLAAIRTLRNRIAHHEAIFDPRWRVNCLDRLLTSFQTISPHLYSRTLDSKSARLTQLQASIESLTT